MDARCNILRAPASSAKTPTHLLENAQNFIQQYETARKLPFDVEFVHYAECPHLVQHTVKIIAITAKQLALQDVVFNMTIQVLRTASVVQGPFNINSFILWSGVPADNKIETQTLYHGDMFQDFDDGCSFKYIFQCLNVNHNRVRDKQSSELLGMALCRHFSSHYETLCTSIIAEFL